MPLIRENKLPPPPPELGAKTFWDYFPKRSMGRIFFLLLALAAVLWLKGGNGSFGGLFDAPKSSGPQRDDPAFQHFQVKPTPQAPKSAP